MAVLASWGHSKSTPNRVNLTFVVDFESCSLLIWLKAFNAELLIL